MLMLLVLFVSFVAGQCADACLTKLGGISQTAFCSNRPATLTLSTFTSADVNATCGVSGCSQFQILASAFSTFGSLLEQFYLPQTGCVGGVYSFLFFPRVEGQYTLEVSPQCSCPAANPGVIVTSCSECKAQNMPCSPKGYPAFDQANNVPNGDQMVFLFP